MLSSLADLGYEVEWRVVNAAEYGFPQKRRRVFIVARAATETSTLAPRRGSCLYRTGVLARAFAVGAARRTTHSSTAARPRTFTSSGDLVRLTRTFDLGGRSLSFPERRRHDRLRRLDSPCGVRLRTGHGGCCGDMLLDESEVPSEFFIPGRAT